MSERSQVILLWWSLAFLAIFAGAWWGLLHMFPPPPATLSAVEIAAFYTTNALSIKIGAVLASWTSAFLVLFAVVVSIQMARLERGTPVWSILQLAGGSLMSLFLVLPPIFWGVAAFTPTRAPDVTALCHEIAILMLDTTDQYYIFQMISIGYVSLTQNPAAAHSPFPRWLGYWSLFGAIVFELGAMAYLARTGPFAWDGLFPFWVPVIGYGSWMTTVYIKLFAALKGQRAALTGAANATGHVSA